MSGAMGAHHSARAGSTTWLTPLSVVSALGEFDLDPYGQEVRVWLEKLASHCSWCSGGASFAGKTLPDRNPAGTTWDAAAGRILGKKPRREM